MPSARRILPLTLVMALALSVSACTGSSTTPTTSAAAPTTSASPSPEESIEVTEEGPTVMGEGVTLPEVEIPGVEEAQDSSEASAHQFSARWSVVPGADALNAKVASAVEARVEAYRKAAPEENPTDAPAELSLWGTVVVANGDYVGVDLMSYEFAGASGETSHQVIFGNADGTWAATSKELVAEAHLNDLAQAIIAGTGSKSADQADVGPSDVVTSLIPQASGDWLVLVNQGVLGPYSAGTLKVTLPGATVEPWLSAQGKALIAAVQAKTPYAVPAPAPSSAPTQAAPPAPAPAPGGTVDCSTAKCVAITYDDGPGPYTDKLLTALQSAGAKATFFMLGQSAKSRPAVVKRAAALGMEIGDHTWNHRDLRKLDAAAARAELDDTATVLRRLSGQPVLIARPPYGSYSAQTKTLGYPLILWDVDTEDWKNRSVATTTSRALATVKSGSIILMHDIQRTSVEATPGIIQALRDRGFTLVTVTELLGTTSPGKTYSRR